MNNQIALAISGGGYRATLYSLGSLWRINEFGLLPSFKTITSVSGGSITSAWLAHNWEKLQFDSNNIASNFHDVIARPLEEFCSFAIDVGAIASGLVSFGESIGDKIAKAYDKHLFNGAKISSLSDIAPEFVFYGSNYQTASGFQISKDRLYDYKLGTYPNPDISLAKTVAISSAFPPLFSPVNLKTDPDKWIKGPYSSYFDNIELRKNLVLADGGLYDNLGLEKVWKGNGEYTHLLVCDAGAPFSVQHKIDTNWASQLMRMTDVMTDQQRALRKRQLIENFQSINGRPKKYGGTYFGITTKIEHYNLPDAMTKDSETTSALKNIRTRLNKFTAEEQGRLINWGYALTDCAIRTHVAEIVHQELLVQGKWPKPEYAL